MLQILTFFALVFITWAQVTQDEFINGITKNGFPRPSKIQYDGYLASLKKGSILSKMEAAMFLAQLLHESGGLRYKSEISCTTGGQRCDSYQTNDWDPSCPRARPGKRYYGRGYIQLTYCSNYRAASRDLGYGELLADQPDLVAERENFAWETAAWYWKTNVQKDPEFKRNPAAFGRTTWVINGAREECQGNGRNREKSEARFNIYSNIFSVYKLPGQPNPGGCNY